MVHKLNPLPFVFTTLLFTLGVFSLSEGLQACSGLCVFDSSPQALVTGLALLFAGVINLLSAVQSPDSVAKASRTTPVGE
jgi:hypothetical protein